MMTLLIYGDYSAAANTAPLAGNCTRQNAKLTPYKGISKAKNVSCGKHDKTTKLWVKDHQLFCRIDRRLSFAPHWAVLFTFLVVRY